MVTPSPRQTRLRPWETQPRIDPWRKAREDSRRNQVFDKIVWHRVVEITAVGAMHEVCHWIYLTCLAF